MGVFLFLLDSLLIDFSFSFDRYSLTIRSLGSSSSLAVCLTLANPSRHQPSPPLAVTFLVIVTFFRFLPTSFRASSPSLLVLFPLFSSISLSRFSFVIPLSFSLSHPLRGLSPVAFLSFSLFPFFSPNVVVSLLRLILSAFFLLLPLVSVPLPLFSRVVFHFFASLFPCPYFFIRLSPGRSLRQPSLALRV